MRASDFHNRRPEGAPWRLPVEHLSATSLTMAQRCPEQWRRRYVLGEKERPGAALVLGSADHRTHEFNYTQKVVSGVDLPTDTMVDFFTDVAWLTAMEEKGGAEEISWNEGEGPDVLRVKGAEMIRVYHETVSPRIQPIAVEVEFRVDVGLPVPILGFVDVEREEALTERKTSKNSMSQPKPEWRLQGRLYQLARPKPVEWHVVTKGKVPKAITPLEAPDLLLEAGNKGPERAAHLARVTGRLLNDMYSTFGPDEPWPGAITHPWACGFCGWRNRCHWWET